MSDNNKILLFAEKVNLLSSNLSLIDDYFENLDSNTRKKYWKGFLVDNSGFLSVSKDHVFAKTIRDIELNEEEDQILHIFRSKVSDRCSHDYKSISTVHELNRYYAFHQAYEGIMILLKIKSSL